MFKQHRFSGKETEIDIVHEVLQQVLEARPDSTFISSLLQQYRERGSLSKKQLEGLHQKAVQCKAVPAARLATLQAKIIKMPTKFKSAPPSPKPEVLKNEHAGRLIDAILSKRPEHKRVSFLKLKYDKNEVLTSQELAELEKFNKLF